MSDVVVTEGLARVREPASGPAGDALPPPRTHERQRGVLVAGWTLLVVAAVVVLVSSRLGLQTAYADVVGRGVAALLTVLLAAALAWRVGGRAVAVAVVTGLLGAAAVVTQWPPLLAGLALAVAVVGSALAVVLTVPGRHPLRALREVGLALVVAAVASLAAGAYAADVDGDRFGYATLGAAVLLTIGAVRGLGGGVHALGRVGTLLVAGSVLLLTAVLLYAWALHEWASPGAVAEVEAVRDRVVDLLGAVPAPLAALVGVPALTVGVALRAQRRQGWWVCAFGALATAPVAAGLAAGTGVATLALATAYAAALGLVLGFVVLLALRLLGRPRAADPRPEPSRTRALS